MKSVPDDLPLPTPVYRIGIYYFLVPVAFLTSTYSAYQAYLEPKHGTSDEWTAQGGWIVEKLSIHLVTGNFPFPHQSDCTMGCIATFRMSSHSMKAFSPTKVLLWLRRREVRGIQGELR